METQAARAILNTLAQGIHPVTGEAMADDAPYNTPIVIRSLFAVSRALDDLPADGMDVRSAHQILDTLAQGIHPITGEVMAEDSPMNAPPIIRALFAVSQALDAPRRVKKRGKTPRELPPNAGKPWQPHEDSTLETAFAAGTEQKLIAEQLGRTTWSIEARLVKLGKVPPRPGLRGMEPSAAAAG